MKDIDIAALFIFPQQRGGEIVESIGVRMQSRSARVRHRLFVTAKLKLKQAYEQFRVVLRALRRPDVPWYSKLVCGCAVLYVASPIQLIPNIIPIIGQMDDVLVIGLSIKLLKRSAPSMFLDNSPRVEEGQKVLVAGC